MKLKFKQNVFISNLNYMSVVGEVKDIEDERQAQSLVDAGYAEKVVDETPSKKVEQEAIIEKDEVVKPAPKKSRKKNEDGEK